MLAAGLATRLTHWFERSGDLYSLGTRAEAAVIVSRIIGAHPLLGVGPANYYHCTPLYRIRGYAVPFSSHDNLLDVAAQTGLVGLAGLLLFAAAVAAVGLRFWRRAPAGFDRGFACGALGGLAGTLVAALLGDWWLPFVYNVTLDGLRAAVPAWILLGALLALARDEAR
jgi:O-antigen ligase